MTSKTEYSLSELCAAAGVTPRTVRYYIREGLLRSPSARGPGARYDDGHLSRLQLVKQLQRLHLPLSEIRSRLAALSDDDVRMLLTNPLEPPATSALDYVRSVLGSKGTAPLLSAAPMQADAASAFARAAPIRPQAYAVSPPAQPSAPKGRPPAIGDTRRGRLGPREQFLAVPDMAPHSVGIPAPPSAAEPAPRAAEPAPASPPSLPDRSTWERIALAPDLELHVRRPLSRIQNKLLERLLELARKLFEEELP